MSRLPERYRAVVGAESWVEEYTWSLREDREIACEILDVTAAHLAGLAEAGLIPSDAAQQLAQILLKYMSRCDAWVPSSGYEDAFEALEALLRREAGDAASYLPLGRSRNDHVAAVLRLYGLRRAAELLDAILEAREALLAKAEEYGCEPWPYFTHLQVGQVGAAAYYFLSQEDALADSFKLILSATQLLKSCPLGSGAAAGTIARLPWGEMCKLLCLDAGRSSPYYSTGSRLPMASLAAATTVLLVELSRFAEDIVILSSSGYGLIEVPPAHISTSSIMPHKRNPVTAEVLRARGGEAIGRLASLLAVTKGLPYGYNLDLQESNRYYYWLLREAARACSVYADLIRGLKLNLDAARKLVTEHPSWGAELAEYIATRGSAPLREAYFRVAEALKRDGWRPGREVKSLMEEVGFKPEPEELVRAKTPEETIRGEIEARWARLRSDRGAADELRSRLAACRSELIRRLEELAGGG